mgnify:CR=1 FL=1|tara:strand:+ start:4359 stop:4730 length:372 start_codon:yes stop_codon:yes gene_type:complete
MYTREELREEFDIAKAKDKAGNKEVYVNRIAMIEMHMNNEKDNPDLYSDLISENGLPLFKWEGLYKAYTSPDPKAYFGAVQETESDEEEYKTTEQMIEDVSVEVPEVPEDEVSKVIGEMNVSR